MSMVLLLVAVTVGAVVPGQSNEAVVASNAIVVPGPNGLTMGEFEVTNRTSQAVTAWEVRVEAKLSNGSFVREGIAPDGYSAYAGVYPDDENVVIRSHASVRGQIPLDVPAGITVVTVQAVLKWAVFADGSWMGDAAGAQALFRRREKDRQTFAFIVAALRAGYAAGEGADALRVALERLNTKDQEDYENPHKQVMRKNLQLAMEGKIQRSPAELLRAWILRMEARWMAAAEHRHPKPAGLGK